MKVFWDVRADGRSGATGEGLEENVREGYAFLANNYTRGDEIFLIGFSRGAFTVRTIAGLIGEVGLLTKKGLPYLREIHKDIQHRRDPHYQPKYPDLPFPRKPSASDPMYRRELERRDLTRLGVTVKAIAVWDTVGSLGVPRIGWLTKVGLQSAESRETMFYDTKLNDIVEHAFQALSLDERRAAFAPAVWEKPEGNQTVLRQVWFPGVHSNVGGGYDDQQLANITLAWMMSQLEPFLDMYMAYVLEQEDENLKYYRRKTGRVRPWSFGKIYNSLTGLYAFGGGTTRTPGRYYAISPETLRASDRPLRDTHEYIHSSCRSRFMLNGPGVDDKNDYMAHALQDYRLVIDNDSATSSSRAPTVFWKARFRNKNVTTRMLPEAPLFRLERELAARDPETYDYVVQPPPQKRKGGGRKKRRSMPASAPTSPRIPPPMPGTFDVDGARPGRRRRKSSRRTRSVGSNDEWWESPSPPTSPPPNGRSRGSSRRPVRPSAE
jgi:hypothetical protein